MTTATTTFHDNITKYSVLHHNAVSILNFSWARLQPKRASITACGLHLDKNAASDAKALTTIQLRPLLRAPVTAHTLTLPRPVRIYY